MRKVLIIGGGDCLVEITRAIEKASIDIGIDFVMLEKSPSVFEPEPIKITSVIPGHIEFPTDKEGKPLTNPGSKYHK